MDLSTLKDDLDCITNKQRSSSSQTQEMIDQIGREIEHVLEKIQAVNDLAFPVDQKSIITDLKTKLKEMGPLNKLNGPQKEVNVVLNKYVKLLEKSFNSDISKAYRNIDFDVHTVNQILAIHFYRKGMFDLGDCFINEARVPEATTLKSSFSEMYQILEAMRFKNLDPALKWAGLNRDKLAQNGSNLELKLHRLQFVEIVKRGNRDDALRYARTYLAPFASRHMAEIQVMACLLWAGRLDCSPYAEFLTPTHWEKLSEELTQQFCSLLGQSYESPLRVVIEAGFQGLPTLLKLADVMIVKKKEWQEMKQLPVSLELGRELQFHSVFVCPVSRDQGSEENPPILMPCGHVLCKQSIAKLGKNSAQTFKCPYCPLYSTIEQCRQVFF